MAAKDVRFGDDARSRMVRGVNVLAAGEIEMTPRKDATGTLTRIVLPVVGGWNQG